MASTSISFRTPLPLSPARARRAGLAVSLAALAVSWAASATAQQLPLVTGSNLGSGSGVALSTTVGLYAPGTAFPTSAVAGPLPGELTLTVGAPATPFFIPNVAFPFGSLFTFEIIDETGAAVSSVQITLDTETGEIFTGAGDPLLRFRMTEWQNFVLVSSDEFGVELTTGTLARAQCGAAPSAELVGAPLDPETGLATIIAATCIEDFGASIGFNRPFLLQLIADFGPACSDGLDNDGDGLVDLVDPGCADPDDVSEMGACEDGTDNDGDGLVDFPDDPGCGSSDDGSEHSSELICDDGLDNDADGLVDFADDPGCGFPMAPTEAPQCDDGLDNDGDGAVDLGDAACVFAWWNSETDLECGLGFELAALLPVLLALRRRRSMVR